MDDLAGIATITVDTNPVARHLEVLGSVEEALAATGPIVALARRLTGATQAEVSTEAGTSVNRVGQIEAGKTPPTINEAVGLLNWAFDALRPFDPGLDAGPTEPESPLRDR